VFELEYLFHESVLRSLGEFSCAGDAEALSFCGEMADAMVSSFGVARDEAVAHINRRWSHSWPRGRSSRVWVVGLDIVYHETPEYWAAHHYTQDGSPQSVGHLPLLGPVSWGRRVHPRDAAPRDLRHEADVRQTRDVAVSGDRRAAR
jgi:hypothetical protein